MPSGRTHTIINAAGYILVVGVLITSRTMIDPLAAGAASASFAIGTLYLSPDLDLSGTVRTNSQRAWGRLGWLWYPYGAVFRHRGISHAWIAGPLTRLGYLWGLWSLLGWLLGLGSALLPEVLQGAVSSLTAQVAGGLRQPPDMEGRLLIAAGIGYVASQWLHLAADGIAPDRWAA